MNLTTLTACIGLAVFANAVSAQVYRCKDASGKTLYSDLPCSGAQSGEQVQRTKTREELLEQRLRIAEENERKATIRAQIAERTPAIVEPQERTLNINYRDNTPDKSKSSECADAKKELDFVSSTLTLSGEARRARIGAAETNVRVSCQ